MGLRHFVFVIIFGFPICARPTCDVSPAPIPQVKKLSCEAEKQAYHCDAFYNSLEKTDAMSKLVRSCNQTSSETEMIGAAVNCGGIAFAAGVSALNSLKPGHLLLRVPAVLKAVVPRILAAADLVTLPLTAYSLYDLTAKALAQDKKCFEDIEGKRDVLNFLKVSSDHVAEELKPYGTRDQLRQVSFAPEYLNDSYVRNLPCQELNQLIMMQKRKQDSVLGPLLAKGVIKFDPRKEFELTDQEKDVMKLLGENSECLSPAKRVELICAAGNLVIGTRTLAKAYLKDIRPKTISVAQDFGTNPQIDIWNMADAGNTREANRLTNLISSEMRSSDIDAIVETYASDNGAVKVRLKNGLVGVWKPAEGSNEVMAYAVDQAIGYNHVPITVNKKMNGVDGTLQLFVAHTDQSHYLVDKPDALKFFDTLIGNEDRHPTNYLVKEGRVVAIDNGYALAHEPTVPIETKISKVTDPLVRQAEKTQRLQQDLESAKRASGTESSDYKKISTQLNQALEKRDRLLAIAKNKLSTLLPDKKVYDKLRSISESEWRNLLKSHIDEEELESFLQNRRDVLKAIDNVKKMLGDPIFRDGPLSPLVRQSAKNSRELLAKDIRADLIEARETGGDIAPIIEKAKQNNVDISDIIKP